VIPVASARFELKYVATIAMLGKNRHPAPMPVTSPCERNSCHFKELICVFIQISRSEEDKTQFGKPNTAKPRKRRESRKKR
jgi:hypothetical protein